MAVFSRLIAELSGCEAPKSLLNCIPVLLLSLSRKGQQIYTEQVKDQPTEVEVENCSVDQEAVVRENRGESFRKRIVMRASMAQCVNSDRSRRQGKRNGGCVVDLSPYFHGFMHKVRRR